MNVFSIVLFTGIALSLAALVRGIFLGYAPASPDAPHLSAKEQAVIAASSDAFFPRGGSLPISATEAGTVAYMSRMLGDAPFRTRMLLRLLFVFVEHGPWLFNLRSRMTRQTPAQRVATLRAWSESPIYFLRVTFTSLRTLVSLAYLANDGVMKAIGTEPNASPFGLHERQESAA